MNENSFIITVDTEGDNIWGKGASDAVSTQNTRYIPRFQDLCEKYGFKPVYLTNYEMLMDNEWVAYSSAKANEGKCEIGLHIHAWNTPPIVPLEGKYNGLPYITEYTAEVIEEKVQTMMLLLREKYQLNIVSHRSGRWATNEEYLNILYRNGIRIDCSFTPGINLSLLPGAAVVGGNDYRKANKYPHILSSGVIEVPMTTRCSHKSYSSSRKQKLKAFLTGEDMWLRTIHKSEKQLIALSKQVQRERKSDYLEFMLHSSELMPGGSPYFRTEEDIDLEYRLLETYFHFISEQGHIGRTLTEYVQECMRLSI